MHWTECNEPLLQRAVVAAPFGRIAISATPEAVVGLDFLRGDQPLVAPTEGLLEMSARQLQCFFDSPDFVFSLPLLGQGTAFQRKVWECLAAIPPGATMTYAEVAAAVNSGPRAVGGACRANPYPIIIPCHRVVASGTMGGYAGKTAGFWMEIKRWLLQHEGVLRNERETGGDRLVPRRPMDRTRAQR